MGYTTLAAVRAAGLSDTTTYPDAAITAAIARVGAFIDRTTRQWFEPRTKTLRLDGSGTATLLLDVPIVSASALYLNGDFETAVPADRYEVYAGRDAAQDDRGCPMIRLRSDSWWGAGRFVRGTRNQQVVGIFGYVEADDTTPALIQDAALRLVIRDLSSPAVPASSAAGGGSGSGPVGPLVSETTEGHSRHWAAPAIGSMRAGTLAVTGDPAVDQILAMYRGPLLGGAVG